MKLMNPPRFRARKDEQGITILLVAVCLAFVVVAFAALAIDITTLYTARSEARLAADPGALSAAKVRSVSVMTSDPTNVTLRDSLREPAGLAATVAKSVASSNMVGGRQLFPSEVTVTPTSTTLAQFSVNPRITVVVQRTDLPTFFSKIW